MAGGRTAEVKIDRPSFARSEIVDVRPRAACSPAREAFNTPDPKSCDFGSMNSVFCRPIEAVSLSLNATSNGFFVADSTARASNWKAASDLNGVVSGKLTGSLLTRADTKAFRSQAWSILHALAARMSARFQKQVRVIEPYNPERCLTSDRQVRRVSRPSIAPDLWHPARAQRRCGVHEHIPKCCGSRSHHRALLAEYRP